MSDSMTAPAPVQGPTPCERCDCPACADSRARNRAALLELEGLTIADFWLLPLDDVTLEAEEAGGYDPPSEEEDLWWGREAAEYAYRTREQMLADEAAEARYWAALWAAEEVADAEIDALWERLEDEDRWRDYGEYLDATGRLEIDEAATRAALADRYSRWD